MTPAGLEPAIPGSVGRCLIHWATGPLDGASEVRKCGSFERKSCFKNKRAQTRPDTRVLSERVGHTRTNDQQNGTQNAMDSSRDRLSKSFSEWLSGSLLKIVPQILVWGAVLRLLLRVVLRMPC